MKIKAREFLAEVSSRKELAAAGLTFDAALIRTRRYYCGQLTVATKCPLNCSDCSAPLKAVIQRIADTENVRIPEAMLTTQLRIAAGDMKEVARPKTEAKPLLDIFGRKTHEDAFSALAETYA